METKETLAERERIALKRTSIEVIDEAIRLLSAEGGWAQFGHSMANAACDKAGRPVLSISSEACSFCLLGALFRASFGGENEYPVLRALHQVVPGSLSGWNDTEGRTREEVVGVLQEARSILTLREASSGS